MNNIGQVLSSQVSLEKPNPKVSMFFVGLLISTELISIGVIVILGLLLSKSFLTIQALKNQQNEALKDNDRCITAQITYKKPDPIIEWTSYSFDNLQFSYPKHWNLQVGIDKSVTISSPSEAEEYRLIILPHDPVNDTKALQDVEYYIYLKEYLSRSKQKDDCYKKEKSYDHCIAQVPGPRNWNFLGNPDLFSNSFSTQELEPRFPILDREDQEKSIENEYMLIYKGYPYQINIAAPKESYLYGNPDKKDAEHPILQILKSIKPSN